VSGFLVIAFLLRYLWVHDFANFLWFGIGVAALVLGVLASGARSGVI
jgi:undecaprenyl pyrophosphate phosphatase UppP